MSPPHILFSTLCTDIFHLAKTAPLTVKAATYSGLLSKNSPTDPNVMCPSGDCTWSDYSSLAVCAACQNVTDFLQINCTESCEASLPGGAVLSKNSTVLSTNVNFTPIIYTNFSNQAHTLGGFQGIAAFDNLSPSRASDISATECMLYMCVHKFHSTVYNGTYSEDVLKTWPDIYNKTEDIRSETDSGDPYERYYNISGTKYGINGWTFTALVDHLQGDLLQGSIITRNGEYDFSSDVMQAIWGFGSFADPINRLAASMTKVVRDGGNQSEAFIEGRVWQPEVYISVHWRWLILPLSLYFLTIVQFVVTVLRTRRSRTGIWRSSALTLAFHGLDRDADEFATARLKRIGARQENEDKLLEAAKGIRVRMVRLEDGTTKLTTIQG